jgi:mannose-6-phosphate isomerase-like protein (cupin superfamily)
MADRSVQVIPLGAGLNIGGVLCKVSAETTGGAYSILELTLPPSGGAPLHTHHREDEVFCIVEGTCEIQSGGETTLAVPGSVVMLPKGIAHAFRNPGQSPTTIVITAVPGGLEGFFEESSQVAPDAPDAAQQFDAIARRYQIDFSPGRN